MLRRAAHVVLSRRLVCAAVVVLTAHWRAASVARAQEAEGPIIIGQREKVPTFGLINTRGLLELIYRYQHDKSNTGTSTSGTSNFTDHQLEQTLTLSADSWIVHPNLVDIKMSGTFGLTEEQSTQPGGANETQIGTIEQYDLSAVFLRKEFAPLTLYGQRHRELVNRQFGPSIDTTTETYGADWNIRSEIFPTQLRYYRLITTQSDPTNQQNFQSTQDTFSWHTENEPAEFQHLAWDYTFNDVSQNSNALNTNTFQSHSAALTHTVEFGDDHRNNLSSSLNVFDQTGLLALRRVHLDETMLLRHSDSFQTDYHYSFNDEHQELNDRTVHRVSAGFQHKLYKSLVTSGSGGVTISDFGDQGSSFEKFANLSVDYTKLVPYGTLSADASVSYDQQDNTLSGGVQHVTAEPHQFNDPLPVIISRSNIVAGSVLVTNTTRTIIYTEGTDYTANYFSDHVELVRNIGGAILDGQDVLVDYSVSSEPSNTVTTLGQGFGIRYAIHEGPLKGLDFYGRFFHQSQDIQSNLPTTFVPDDVTDITVGTDYRYQQLSLNAEHQIHDSTISPFDVSRFTARWSDRFSRETSYNLNATYAMVNYTQQGNQTAFLIFNGSVQHQVTKKLYISGGLTIRDERDDQRGTTDAFEQHFELRWKHRQTELYLQARNNFVTGDHEDRMSQSMTLGLRRRF